MIATTPGTFPRPDKSCMLPIPLKIVLFTSHKTFTCLAGVGVRLEDPRESLS